MKKIFTILLLYTSGLYTGFADSGRTKPLSFEEIENLVATATGKDYANAKLARAALSDLQLHEEFVHLMLLREKNQGSQHVTRTIGDVFSDIGEKAVPSLFQKSVDHEAGKASEISGAGGILTHYIRYEAIPFLVTKLDSGTLAEKQFSAWALYSICRARRPEVKDPHRLSEALHKAATTSHDSYIKNYSRDALCGFDDSEAVPFLVKFLSEPEFVKHACEGLSSFESDILQATPHIRKLIESGNYPAEAFEALVNAGGYEQIPFIVEHLSDFKSNDYQTWHTKTLALLKHPHPAAIPFMEEVLWSPDCPTHVKEFAGLYFSRIEHEASVKNLAQCLDYPYPETTENGTRGLASSNDSIHSSTASHLRTLAVKYLTNRGYEEFHDKILALLKNDPSINVRTSVVEAIAQSLIPGRKATEDLKKLLYIRDSSYTKWGYRERSLPKATVRALANIGTAEALQALYAAMTESPSKEYCFRFWSQNMDRSVFEVFLQFYRKSPIPPRYASAILLAQLQRHNKYYALPDHQADQQKEKFLSTVNHPRYFGTDVDLTRDGTLTAQLHFKFHTIEYAVVHIDLEKVGKGAGHVHDVTTVYKQVGNEWFPIEE